jgi:Rubrerythrin
MLRAVASPPNVARRIRVGKSLKGSKSHDNLKAAFAGESQPNRRYLYFARVADIEGFPDAAGLFKDTARGWVRGPRDRDPRGQLRP